MTSFLHSFFYDSPTVRPPSHLPTTFIHLNLSSVIKRNEIVSNLPTTPYPHLCPPLPPPPPPNFLYRPRSLLTREEEDNCEEARDGMQTQEDLNGYPTTVCHPSLPIPGQLHSGQVASLTVLISLRDFPAGDKVETSGFFGGLPHWNRCICPGVVAASAVLELRDKTPHFYRFMWVVMGCLGWRHLVFDFTL